MAQDRHRPQCFAVINHFRGGGGGWAYLIQDGDV